MGTTVTRLVQDPPAVLFLDNRLYNNVTRPLLISFLVQMLLTPTLGLQRNGSCCHCKKIPSVFHKNLNCRTMSCIATRVILKLKCTLQDNISATWRRLSNSKTKCLSLLSDGLRQAQRPGQTHSNPHQRETLPLWTLRICLQDQEQFVQTLQVSNTQPQSWKRYRQF